MRRFLNYNSKLKDRARELRKNMTEPEKKIWFQFFKVIQLKAEIRVLRQRPIDNFIVDFYIPSLKVVVEIDWESHFDEKWIVYDEERTNILEWLWLTVIRYTNKEIMENFDWVSKDLYEKINNLIWKES